MNKDLHNYIIQLGDNSLILGHRISEWCGHGPVLEQDIALTNIALDHVGQARMYYQLAATMEPGKTEDDYAYLRTVTEYKNLLLLEQENKDFGFTIARSFYYDQFHLLLLRTLKSCGNKNLSEIAAQAYKEVSYHCRFSSDWIKRLGDGTEESHRRIQRALDDFFPYTAEFFAPSEADNYMTDKYGVDLSKLSSQWSVIIEDIVREATLTMPTTPYPQLGGKQGRHSEKLGFILTELQYMQRTYPNSTW